MSLKSPTTARVALHGERKRSSRNKKENGSTRESIKTFKFILLPHWLNKCL
jgi:hypothetical protein